MVQSHKNSNKSSKNHLKSLVYRTRVVKHACRTSLHTPSTAWQMGSGEKRSDQAIDLCSANFAYLPSRISLEPSFARRDGIYQLFSPNKLVTWMGKRMFQEISPWWRHPRKTLWDPDDAEPQLLQHTRGWFGSSASTPKLHQSCQWKSMGTIKTTL